MAGGIRLWDAGVRVFHWGLAISIAASFITVNQGDMEAHRNFGFVALVLVLFRIVWGVIGSEPARFASFLRGPGAVLRYLRTGAQDRPGHSPLGGLAVVALLAAVLVQVATGLFANDDIFFDGPWAGAVGKTLSDQATVWHKTSQWVLLGLIGLHLAAIFAYHLRGRNLLGPMLSGIAEGDSQPAMAPGLRALIVAAGAVAVAGVVFRFWLL